MARLLDLNDYMEIYWRALRRTLDDKQRSTGRTYARLARWASEHGYQPEVSLAEAGHKYADGDIPDAILRVTEALAGISPRLAGLALYFQGVLLHADGQHEQAINSLQAAADDMEFCHRGHAIHMLGVIHHEQARYDEAVRCFEQALALPGFDAPAQSLFGLAVVNHQIGIPDKAIEYYRLALQQPDLRNPGTAWLMLGNLYNAKQQVGEAISCYKHALDVPGFGDRGRALLGLANSYMLQGQLDEAMHFYEMCKDLLDNHNLAYLRMALGFHSAVRSEYDDAVRFFREAISTPDLSVPGLAWFSLGEAYSAKNDFIEAIRCYQYAIDNPKGASVGRVWSSLGEAYAETGQYDTAITSYERALDSADPELKRSDIWHRLGRLYAARQDWNDAIHCYNEAISSGGSDGVGWFWLDLGIAYRTQGNYDESARCFRSALDSVGFDQPAVAWYQLGLTLLAKGEYHEAADCLNQALDLPGMHDPGWAWLNLGRAYLKMRRNGDAIDCYQHAVEALGDKTPGRAWYDLALLHNRMGNYDSAIEFYTLTLTSSDFPAPGFALAGLGKSHSAKLNLGEAIKCWREAEQWFREHGNDRMAQRMQEFADNAARHGQAFQHSYLSTGSAYGCSAVGVEVEDTDPTGDPEQEARAYVVWYATNRKPDETGNGYTADRDTTTHYGTCKVCVPEAHRFGSVGSSWFKRWIVLHSDDRLKIVERVSFDEESEFWAAARQSLASLHTDDRVGLVYIHGYNVCFDNAAIRAAQLGYDLKVPGMTGFFSWPSQGTAIGYLADEASIEASETSIADFLVKFATDSGAEVVHVIAHSMGNRGLLRAMQRIISQAQLVSSVKFGQVFLAAPDIDVDTFRSLADAYPKLSSRTTLYFSRTDLAVELSHWIHKYDRVGYAPPVTIIDGVDSVEVSNVDFSLLGHGYYAEACDLLYDIHRLMLHDDPPNRRTRLQPAVTTSGERYWTFCR